MEENTGERRRETIDDIVMQHATGIETLGTAIRRLRLEVTGLDQETFAVMCNMSTKALYQIEKDKGKPYHQHPRSHPEEVRAATGADEGCHKPLRATSRAEKNGL